MKAIVCSGNGGWDDVHYQEFPKPEVRPRGVIIKVEAAALNFPDTLQPKGLYQDIPQWPFVLGLEFAGTVTETGADCTRLKVGDRIVGMGQGAFGEYLSAREQMCFKLPDGIDFETAAAIPLSGGTAMLGLDHCGKLKAGETLVVLGAAGGTGLFAVQIGCALGAEVIGVCSSDEKAAAVLAAGAKLAINSNDENLSARLKEVTDGRGVDVVYDPVGGDQFDICSRRMAMGGRLLSVGYASGRIPTLSANLPLLKSYSLTGVNWSAYAWSRPDISLPLMDKLFGLIEQGIFTPRIDRRVPLTQTIDAIKRMEARQAIGKTVVRLG